MIPKQHLEELDLIVKVINLRPPGLGLIDVMTLTCEALVDAIKSTDVDEAIKYIIITYPELTESLLATVKKDFPDKLIDVQKLIILK